MLTELHNVRECENSLVIIKSIRKQIDFMFQNRVRTFSEIISLNTIIVENDFIKILRKIGMHY